MRTLLTLAFTATMALAAQADGVTMQRNQLPLNVTPVGSTSVSTQQLSEIDVEPLQVQPQLLNLAQPRVMRSSGVSTLADTDSEWTSLGMGKYTDGLVGYLFGVDSDPWEVEMQQNNENPALYRIVNPYTNGNCPWNASQQRTLRSDENTYFIIDTTNPSSVTFTEPAVGDVMALNVAYSTSYGESYLYNTGATGTFSNYIISFPAQAMYSRLGSSSYYYADAMQFALPGAPDYSVKVTANELCFDDNKVSFTVEAGADVAKMYYGIYSEGRYNATQSNFRTVLSAEREIGAGTWSVSLSGTSWYSIFVVGVDADGYMVSGDVDYVYSFDHDPTEWKELGNAVFSDDTFAPLYGITDDLGSWEVPVYESVNTPGLYRLVDAYAAHPFVTANIFTYHTGHTHYLDVDASDPTAVTIDTQPIGLYYEGDMLAISSYEVGTLVDNVITFPNRGMITEVDGHSYYANQYSRFSITLPVASEPEEPETPEAPDYTLDLGTSTQAGRYISSLDLSDDAESEAVTVGPARSSSVLEIYQDLSDQVFATAPGATVTVVVNGEGSWMHTYAYVDWARDGFVYTTPADLIDLDTYKPLEGSDLVYYNSWNPNADETGDWYNSDGNVASNNQSVAVTFTFTVPENANGEYRMRVKSAWQSLDPNGGIDVSASNNTIQANGGTVVDFTLNVVVPEEPHTYVTFEANRKDQGENHWGVYLQDANEVVEGAYGKSTLCGTDELTLNCVWELFPGSVEGAYYVQNYVTGKYLVDLQAYNDQTLDEPVDIWFHEFTLDGLTGIQIATGATIDGNCIDQDNCDSLCGWWANDAGDLWFMSTLDATTPEALEALFSGDTPEPGSEVVDAFKAALETASTLAELYLKSIPFMSDEIRALVEVSLPDAFANAEAYAQMFSSAEEAQAFVYAMMAQIEQQLVEDLKVNADKPWTLYQPGQDAYLSAETTATNQGWDSFNYQASVNTLGYWTLEAEGDYYLLKSAKGQYVATPKVHYCKVVDSASEAGKFALGVKDGYVVFIATDFDNCGLGLDGQNDPAEIMSLDDATMGYGWQVDLYSGDLWDGISSVSTLEDTTTVIYDLQGRRVNTVSTGLYIINGVKTLIRK